MAYYLRSRTDSEVSQTQLWYRCKFPALRAYGMWRFPSHLHVLSFGPPLSSFVHCADKRLMGREMLSLKGPKQMFSENEDIVLEQRPTVQVNRARVFSTTLSCICYCKREHMYSAAHNSSRLKKIEINHCMSVSWFPQRSTLRHKRGENGVFLKIIYVISSRLKHQKYFKDKTAGKHG